MMSANFSKLAPLSADCTICAGNEGPEPFQKMLMALGCSLLFSITRDGDDEVQRWTSADGGRAVDLHVSKRKRVKDPVPTHRGVGSSLSAKVFLEAYEELRLEAEECPEAYDFFFPNRSMLDVVAFYELDPEDRFTLVN